MRYIGYAELNPGRDFPSIKATLSKEAYAHKNNIVQFLQNGEIELVRMSRAKDVFTGETIPYEVAVMHDGDFWWSSEIAWYVEKYNLRLPKDFEKHILEKS